MRRIAVSFVATWVLIAGQAASAGLPAALPRVTPAGTIHSFDLVTAGWGWVLAGDRLYATSDAGSTWVEITPPLNRPLLACTQPRPVAAAFADPLAGMAVLACAGAPANGAALARTADGGRTWSLLPFPAQVTDAFAGPSGALHLQLVDARTALLGVDTLTSSNFSLGRLFATDNAGESWEERSLPTGGPVLFSDAQTGWAAGGAAADALFRTTDGGATWTTRSPSPPESAGWGEAGSPLFQLPTLLDDGRALLPVTLGAPQGTHVRLYVTEDAGESWQLAAELPAAAEAAPGVAVPVAALDAGGWLLRLPGSDTLLRIRQDASSGWSVATAGRGSLAATIRALDMAGGMTGWALGQWGSCEPNCRQETALLRTTDGGATWASLASASSRAAGMPAAPAARDGTPQEGSSRTRTLAGQGLDTCEAPSLAALQAWMDDGPYRSVNLYVGGVNRACGNARLTPDYVESLAAQGWTFIPTWVGPQAACWGYPGAKMSYDPAVAYAQGRAEADSAAGAATALGLAEPGEGTVLYYDLEAYNTGNAACRQAAKAFVQGWTERLQALGQVAGAYGAGCASAPSDWAALPSPPGALWAAHWIHDSYTPEATVWDVACLSNALWPNHQRLRQYTGGHNEVWGTTNLTIDCDVLDGIVSDVRQVWHCDAGEPCRTFYLPIAFGSSR